MKNQTGRLFQIIDLLQSRGRLTTQALAVQLQVSERTIRRDLLRLQTIDVPIEVTPGRHGGVRIPPGTLLPALRFTDDELLALTLGVKQLSALGDPPLARASARALKRLETVLTERTRRRVEALTQALASNPAQQPAQIGMPSEGVLELAEAIHHRQRVTLSYTSPTRNTSIRSVDPYGLVRLGHWYLTAYCHTRQALRTFRLDRIRSFTTTGEPFVRPNAFDAFTAVAASIAQAPAHGDLVARARLCTSLEEASRLVPATVVVLEPDPEGVLVSIRVKPEEVEILALHLLRLPCQLKVLGPAELHEAFARLAERARAVSRGTKG